jgi:hypothetical protein
MELAHAFWPRGYRLLAGFDPLIEPVGGGSVSATSLGW